MPSTTPSMRAAEVALCAAPALVALAFSTAFYPAFAPLKEALLLLLAAVLFAVALACGWLRAQPAGWKALVTAYCGVVVISWLASFRRDMGWNAAVGLVAAPLLACVAAAVLRDRFALMEAMAATGGFEACLGLAQWLAKFDPHQIVYRAATPVTYQMFDSARPIGTLGDPDGLALVIAASFPAALTLAGDTRRSRGRRLVWLAIAVLELAAIGGTACRASLVGALIGGAIVALSRAGGMRRRTIVTAAAVLCLAATAFVAARVANRRNTLNVDLATNARTFNWRVSTSGWPGTPLLGSGPGTFAFFYMRLEGPWIREHGVSFLPFAGANQDAQNDFLQAWLETGWLGFATLVALLVWWTRLALRLARSEDREQRAAAFAALGGVATLCTVAFVETALYHPASRLLLWLWMALPLTFAARPQPGSRFVTVRIAAAAVVFVALGWTGVRIAVSHDWTEGALRAEFAGHYGQAAALDRKAIALDPSNTYPHFFLSRTLWKAGDFAGSLRSIDDALSRDSHPRVMLMKVRVLYYSGRYSDAARLAAEWMRVTPWAPELESWYKLARAKTLRPASSVPPRTP